ncbi:hypothetical protein ATO6_01110 [Oceanicola sp. 22II-s10i]|uniref:FxLYD domain-containing protein n=1 Tax=Oceanicola sp. 22II-s10i TaxID=1317116 RepID=UPI000B524C10|nr:FxLYD domain-containing protein [Oceanicola sp. 22II-s10i]OWU85571.1 hypothetical protein ATO6_01110 [Oceanicola sp. 22II-s10i]
MPIHAPAIVSKTSAAIVAGIGLVSGIVGLLYSDMFSVTASLVPMVSFQNEVQDDPSTRALFFSFKNNSDLPMQNAKIYFALYDADGNVILSD